MEYIIRKDESALDNREKENLIRTIEKLEQFYPNRKIFAFDALCPTQRKDSSALSKRLGYESVESFLAAYGFEVISGSEVYELRKNCNIKPGEEPSFIKDRIDAAIHNLNEFYPDHIIDSGIKREHKRLASNLTGFWQWLGYKSLGDMLAAYGFTYSLSENASKGGRPSTVNPSAIIEELKNRYPNGIELTALEIKAANPDLKIKSVMNKSKELFGMTFTDYLTEQGIIRKHIKTAEEIAANIAAHEAWKKEYEDKKASEDLASYETYYQRAYLGWRTLPYTAEQLFKENSNYKSKRRIDNIVERFGIDADSHFMQLGVLTTDNSDNDFRALIQNISFEKIIQETGLPIYFIEDQSKERETESRQVVYYETAEKNDKPSGTVGTSDLQLEGLSKATSDLNDKKLTTIQLECLSAIKSLSAQSPVVKAADVVRLTGRSKSSISVHLNALRDMGLVNIGDNGWITVNGEETDCERSQAISKSDEEIMTWIAGLGVGGTQYEYLTTIASLSKKAPIVRSIDICNALGKSRSTVSTALKAMKEAGYIKVDNDKGWISLNID